MLYQFLPRLSDEDYAALEASILEHGIQVPVIVDENGSVIDGYHRTEIAERHGLECPTRTQAGLTEAHKRTLALSLNVDRRHLTREQKRELVKASLAADPDLSDRGHAKRTGVSPTTVGAIREQVSNLDTSPEPDPVLRPDEVAALVGGGFVESAEHLAEIAGLNTATGEIVDIPTVTEHTVTEKTKTVTGLDGKTYTQKPATPKRRSLVDDAYTANRELFKAIERIRTIRNDDRYARNKADILAALQPSADLANEILADLFTTPKEK